jgi:SAM-dependent methyltransferase
MAQSYLLPHDWVYDSEYYNETVDGAARASAPIMAQTIAQELHPRHVIDVGCGTGALLESLRNLGCEVVGLEKSTAAIKMCKERGLDVHDFDLESGTNPMNRSFDVAVSMEVAEHLPQSVDERYIDLLTSLGETVVFTAAPPGQGGTDHINEQPPEYWFAKFERRGFHFNRALSDRWRSDWQATGKVQDWYYKNLMLFDRTNRSS